MPSRRKSREYAMQMLYQWELGGGTPEQVSAIQRLDQLIREHAENWRLERMAAVDRSILRTAVYELVNCPEAPPRAVINEALEIARRFSGEGSVEFVNGILDSVLKSLPAGRIQN
jgi:N utilization substance protein B